MSTIQTVPPPIEKATTQHNLLFAVYILILLLTAGMTWLVWKSGNRLQDAIRKDADARIAESNAEAKRANERAENLEHANLTLRNDLNTESAKVAGLQKAASDALAEQQRVQTELEAQRGRTATLEKAAADAKTAQQRMEINLANAQTEAANAIQAANQAGFAAFKEQWEREEATRLSFPRKLDIARENEYIEQLRPYAGTEVFFQTLPDTEPNRVCQMIGGLLERAGWKVLGIQQVQGTTEQQIPDGIWVETNGPIVSIPPNPLRPALEALTDVLNDSNISANRSFLNPWLPPATLPPNTVRVVVGLFPNSYIEAKKWREDNERDRRQRMFPGNAPKKSKPE